jgi:hypothetical protein
MCTVDKLLGDFYVMNQYVPEYMCDAPVNSFHHERLKICIVSYL